MLLASFPSPSRAVWDLGPIPIRAYALCIIVGIIAAIWIGERRWVARGGQRGTVSDIAVWAVIFGLIGGRLYHVITDNELYFRAGRDPWRAFYVWEGGLGVWGAIALGGVGAWIGCRRRGIKLPPFADAAAPGIAVAQGIGRLGNYFNQELFGRPTDLPWAVRIDPDRPSTVPGATGYHPTFLYEMLWDFGLAGVLIYVDRRFTMGRGRVFALYVMGYTAGRVWIEMLRIDTANHVLGLRLNVWTSIIVFVGGLAYFLLHPGPRETVVEPGPEPVTDTPAGAAAVAAGEKSAADEADSSDEDTPGNEARAPAGETGARADAAKVGTATAVESTGESTGEDAVETAGEDAGEDEDATADEPDPAGTADPAATETADGAQRAERADGAQRAERADEAERAERADEAERAERADAAERAERADGAERAERADGAERAERADGAQRAEGVEAVERVEAVKRARTAETAADGDSVDSAHSADSVDSAESAEPPEPAASADSAKSAASAESPKSAGSGDSAVADVAAEDGVPAGRRKR